MKIHKVTKKEFKQFKKRYYYWKRKLRISGWSIVIEHTRMDTHNYAHTKAGWDNREARVKFNTRLDKKLCVKGWIEETAVHEVCDLLLSRLVILGNARYVGEYADLVEANHEVTQILTNYLLKRS